MRLADLLAALSLATDLGMGHPPEEALRTCLVATGLARRLGVAETAVADVYWASLLMHVGCTAFAHEQAALFGGDEIQVNAIGSKTDFANPRESVAFLLELGRPLRPVRRARLWASGLIKGDRFGRDVAAATCEVAAGMARRLGLSAEVQRALHELFERWDGKGAPQRLKGEEIALPARVSQLAAQAVVFDRLGGVEAALDTVWRRAGAGLDPGLTEKFVLHGRDLLREVQDSDPWQAVLEAEPAPQRSLLDADVDDVARAFADAIDLKSPFTLGHSTGVATLAERAGRALGLSEEEAVCLRRAGLFHDLGRVAVPNGIWEKPGTLTAGEWERVRLHAYHSERILSRSTVLAPLAPLAGMHHERLDGSGYHRQVGGAAISVVARVLAAADAFQAMTQRRAHRPALAPTRAAEQLETEARAGRMDAAAVEAVLSAAGRPVHRPVRQGWPAGLTDREVEVLRLAARGLSNRRIGEELYISAKTVGHHIEHIYRKLGVSSRAAATMFAVEHDLLPDRSD